MPVLDKLTTEVSWDIDTSKLEQYEVKVSQAEVSTGELSAEISKTDKALNSVDGTKLADVGEVSQEVSIDLNALAVSSNSALLKLVQMAEEAKSAGAALDAEAKKTAKAEKESKDFADALQRLESGLSGFALGLAKIGGLVAGIFTGTGVLASREIGIQARLAGSVGMTTDAYLAWDGVLGQMGLNGERAVDMIGETANKLGELQGLGEMSSAQDALKMLNLEFKDLQTLKPEEQFRAIMSAAKDIEDEGVARSAVDMIFGGDASKVLGHLRTLDGSLDDILDQYRKYNFLTERGVAGSAMLADSLKNIGTAGKTFLAEVTGRLAETLQPTVDQFFEWALVNREIIDQKIEGVVKGLSDAVRWLAWGAEKVVKLMESMGGVANAIKSVAVAFGAWKLQTWIVQLAALASKMQMSSSALKGMEIASKGLKSVGLAGLFGAAYLALEDLYYYLTDGKSAIGRFMDENLPKAESAILHFFGVLDEGMSKQQKIDATAAFRAGILDGIERTKEMFSSADGFFGTLSGAAGYAGENIRGAFFGALDSVSEKFGEFFVGVDAYFGNAADSIGSILAGIGDFVSTLFSSILATIQNTISGVGTAIADFFSGIFQSISDKFFAVVESIKTAAKSIPVIGDMISGAPTLAAGPIPAFAGAGLAPIPSGTISGVSTSPSWARKMQGGAQTVNMNSPITVNAKTDASAQEIGEAVSKALKNNFSGIKTTGIKR